MLLVIEVKAVQQCIAPIGMNVGGSERSTDVARSMFARQRKASCSIPFSGRT